MEIAIDTHALIWYLTGDKKLSKKAKEAIDRLIKTQTRLIIPIVVMMEVLILIEKKKIGITWKEFNQKISEFPNVIVYPIGLDVLETMKVVGKNLELHDRSIVATAVLHEAVIISRDEEISAEKNIKVIW